MRAVVTGAGGFIGGHLVEALERRGAAVRGLARATADLGQVSTEALAEQLAGHDVVFHLAALTRAADLATYCRTNVEGTRRVLEAAAAAGCQRFVLVSSLAAVGPSRDGTPIDESAAARPVSWYGQSKLEAERLAATYADRLGVVVVRPAIVYGPRDRYSLLYLRALARRLRPLPARELRLSLVHVSDVVDALIRAAATSTGTYHVAAPEAVPLSDLARRLSALLGRSAIELRLPDRTLLGLAALAEAAARLRGRAPALSRDKVRELLAGSWVTRSAKAEAELGWRAAVPLDDGLRATIAWYRDAGWL